MFTTGSKGRKGTVRRQKWTYSTHLKSSLTGVMILSDCFFRVKSNTGEEKNVRIVIMVLAYATEYFCSGSMPGSLHMTSHPSLSEDE